MHPPSRNIAIRGLVTVIRDRRLPYRVERAVDRWSRALGRHEKTLRQDGLTLRVRRQTCDEDFVRLVIAEREYLQHGVTIRPTDTVVDIGGNIGCFAVLAARMAKDGRVVTVEPDPENLTLLHTNVRNNRLKNVTIIEGAVAGRTGSLTLHTSTHGGGFHTVRPERLPYTAPVRHVPCLSLRDLFRTNAISQCHLLKIDCEGAEWDILHHADAEALGRIQTIAMEYHGAHDSETRERQVSTLLASLPAFHVIAHERFPQNPGGHLWLGQSRPNT